MCLIYILTRELQMVKLLDYVRLILFIFKEGSIKIISKKHRSRSTTKKENYRNEVYTKACKISHQLV